MLWDIYIQQVAKAVDVWSFDEHLENRLSKLNCIDVITMLFEKEREGH